MPTAPIAAVWGADLVRSVGAWPQLPRDEDTALKWVAPAVSGGVSVAEAVYVYRRGVPGQTTQSDVYQKAGRWCRGVALDRLRGLVADGRADADLLEGD